MRFMFVCWPFENQGSGLVIQGYSEAAPALGHEVAVYGRPHANIPLNYSLDLESADAVVFVFEWTTQLWESDNLDLLRLVGRVPRDRRVILDGDGNYNKMINVQADYNHKDVEASHRWVNLCDSLSDKICQPTLHPLRPNVYPFLFYAYNPKWEVELNFRNKEYSMMYLGNSKFRWPAMSRVLRAIEPVRGRFGRLGLVGHGWEAVPDWAAAMNMEDAYFTDREYLTRIGAETLPPVPFGEVLTWMSKGLFNPVLSRPTFSHLRFVTPRFFETPAANTIPIFGLDDPHVEEIYGESAANLVLGEGTAGTERLLDLVSRPEVYIDVVYRIREHLRARHSHAARLRQLAGIVSS